MRLVFYDLETTGLTRRDEPIQFGAIVTDEKLIPRNFCSFYCETQVPISQGSYAVHGITKELLHSLAGGKTFEDKFFELPFVKNDKETVWCSYSTSGFDERLVNQALLNNGLEKYDFGPTTKSLDTISGKCLFKVYDTLRVRKSHGKDKKLMQYVFETGITEDAFNKLYTLMTHEDGKFHDALFDAFALWYIVYQNKELLGFGI